MCANAVGGVPIKRQADILARGVDLLIATPGRLLDLLDQKSVILDDVVITTIDEARPHGRHGFSSTRLRRFSTRLRKTVSVFSFRRHSTARSTIWSRVTCAIRRRTRLLPRLRPSRPWSITCFSSTATTRDPLSHISLRARGGTIMFVKTKHGVDRLAQHLHLIGVSAGALHGGKTQNNRTKTLASFSDGTTPVLVATDVAARGIHVDDVTLVVHVDPPAEAKDYLHRAGRTARAGESGVVVTIVTDEERESVEKLTKQAGIKVHGVRVRPDDLELTRITGAMEPTGIPVEAPDTTVAVKHTAKRGRQEHDTAGRTAAGGRMKKDGDKPRRFPRGASPIRRV